MPIFPNCVKNVRLQTLSDCQIQQTADAENFGPFELRLNHPLMIRCTEQSLNDRNKIANERQVNNCDLRFDRDMCTFVIISPSTIIFENFRRAPPPSKSAKEYTGITQKSNHKELIFNHFKCKPCGGGGTDQSFVFP